MKTYILSLFLLSIGSLFSQTDLIPISLKIHDESVFKPADSIHIFFITPTSELSTESPTLTLKNKDGVFLLDTLVPNGIYTLGVPIEKYGIMSFIELNTDLHTTLDITIPSKSRNLVYKYGPEKQVIEQHKIICRMPMRSVQYYPLSYTINTGFHILITRKDIEEGFY